MQGRNEWVAVERAVAEMRAGRPVIVAGKEAVLAVGIEGLDTELAARLHAVAGRNARLALPAARLRRLGLERQAAGVLALPALDLNRIAKLSLSLDAVLDAPVSPTGPLDDAALELTRIALVLPTVVVIPLDADGVDPLWLTVPAAALMAYRKERAASLHIIGRAPVPLEGAPQSEFIVFRGGEGLRDQVAVIIGKPDRAAPVGVRLHSACLTGDLFGSLKCDCGDQLRETARYMAESGGGVILYLDQEGRGTGIGNKMRAYKLQSQGFDTYDADEALGFEFDNRRFDFAAEMLRQLGFTKVAVFTNNPDKAHALRDAGLEVAAVLPVLGRRTPENVSYLMAKRDRGGHQIDLEGPVTIARNDPA